MVGSLTDTRQRTFSVDSRPRIVTEKSPLDQDTDSGIDGWGTGDNYAYLYLKKVSYARCGDAN